MRERRSQEIRELEGLMRQMEKRLKAALRENLRLRKELDKISNSIESGGEDAEGMPLPKKVEPSFTCENCGNLTSTVIPLTIMGKNQMMFEICKQCKHRKKI